MKSFNLDLHQSSLLTLRIENLILTAHVMPTSYITLPRECWCYSSPPPFSSPLCSFRCFSPPPSPLPNCCSIAFSFSFIFHPDTIFFIRLHRNLKIKRSLTLILKEELQSEINISQRTQSSQEQFWLSRGCWAIAVSLPCYI